MAVIKRPSPSGYVIFCDDIRQETSGKLFYIGVYAGHEMIVYADNWPVAIPKFGFSISIGADDKLFSTIKEIRVYLPGDADESPSIQIPVPYNESASSMPPALSGDLMRGFTNHFVVSPLLLKQEGRINAIAYFGDDIFKLGSLSVKRSPIPKEATITATKPS
jgi:hypothetical protein